MPRPTLPPMGRARCCSQIAILASIAFNSRVTFDDVYVEGITGLSPLDIEYGRGRLCGQTSGYRAGNRRSDSSPGTPAYLGTILWQLLTGFNAIFINGDAVGELMFYGRGAGQMPTASAIVGDIMASPPALSGYEEQCFL